jgi:hypothetical protein
MDIQEIYRLSLYVKPDEQLEFELDHPLYQSELDKLNRWVNEDRTDGIQTVIARNGPMKLKATAYRKRNCIR